ncbi:MAG: hypothetical protein PHR66_14510 [Desulfuromonadaceae bacterium]|nr:hypothetical protein [Desulfuromonadaceae bacterium]
MLTLTFAGDAPDLITADNARRIFFKRFSRRFPDSCGVWVREYGEENGRIHFHVLIYGSDFFPVRVLRECWQYGAVHARRLARPAYLSKYLSKRSPRQDEPGRWWGIINRDMYNRLADVQVIELPRDVACQWRRLIRNHARKQIRKKVHTSRSFLDPRPFLRWRSAGRVDIRPPISYNMIKLDINSSCDKEDNSKLPTELITAVAQQEVNTINWWELISYTAGIVQALTSESLTHQEKKQKATELIKRYYLSLPYQPIPVYLLDLLVPALIEQVYRWVVK